MRALIDTNVALDILQKREPFVMDALNLFALEEAGKVELLISCDAISTIFYIVSKDTGMDNAHRAIDLLMGYVDVVGFNKAVVNEANASPIVDLEDALVAQVASDQHADVLVTRDVRGFKGSTVPVMTPSELVAILMR